MFYYLLLRNINVNALFKTAPKIPARTVKSLVLFKLTCTIYIECSEATVRVYFLPIITLAVKADQLYHKKRVMATNIP